MKGDATRAILTLSPLRLFERTKGGAESSGQIVFESSDKDAGHAHSVGAIREHPLLDVPKPRPKPALKRRQAPGWIRPALRVAARDDRQCAPPSCGHEPRGS